MYSSALIIMFELILGDDGDKTSSSTTEMIPTSSPKSDICGENRFQCKQTGMFWNALYFLIPFRCGTSCYFCSCIMFFHDDIKRNIQRICF